MAILYTFNGMDAAESEIWLKSMRENVALPTTVEFKIKKEDPGAVKANKKRKQEAFLKMREKEIQDKLAQHQAFRSVGRVTFEVGVPRDLEALDDSWPGMPKDEPRALVILTKEEIKKLNGLVTKGVFSREEKKSEEKKPEEKKGK